MQGFESSDPFTALIDCHGILPNSIAIKLVLCSISLPPFLSGPHDDRTCLLPLSSGRQRDTRGDRPAASRTFSIESRFSDYDESLHGQCAVQWRLEGESIWKYHTKRLLQRFSIMQFVSLAGTTNRAGIWQGTTFFVFEEHHNADWHGNHAARQLRHSVCLCHLFLPLNFNCCDGKWEGMTALALEEDHIQEKRDL